MQCKQCGAQFEGKFCPQCGAPAEEKMSVCPVCGKARSGEDRFCSECGYDFEKKPSAAASAQTSVSAPAAAPQRSAAVARKPFPKKQVLTAVAVVAVIAILLAILIPTISFFTNKFRIGVVEKINLGDSREQVLDLLGEPYDYAEGSSFFEYYSDNYRKLLEQNDSFDPDDIENWEDFGDAFDEALELEQKLQTEEYQYISVSFDSDGGVSAVFLDTACCEQNTGKKALKSCSVLTERITAIESEDVYVTEMLPYEAEYTDGSYYMGFTNATSADSGSSAIIRWNDRYGNECSARTEVILNPSGDGWYFDTLEDVLHITSDQENYSVPAEIRYYVDIVQVSPAVTSLGYGMFVGYYSLAEISIPDSVTSIGSHAFYGCDSLTSITIPDSVTSIGEEAFYGCGSLTSVTIGDGVTSIGDLMFANCSRLTSVTIGNGVTSIGESAFQSCSGLTSVAIPDSVTVIGEDAFSGCESLTSVYITDIAAWCAIDFGGYVANPLYYAHNLYLNGELVTDLVIPDGVTSIEGFAFYNCSSLTSVTIPDSVTSIGSYAFYDCHIESVTMPTLAIYSIPQDNLKTVVLTSGTSIGASAFYNCGSLTSITIPDGVTSIGDRAFQYCDSLTSVYITDIAAWCTIDFDDYANPLSYANNLYLNGELMTDLVIPDGVTSIGGRAFSNCDSLTSITIPDSVTSIGASAFSNCDSLASVTIGDSVTSIGDSAFYGCSGLTSITIPDSVTSIGERAFEYCYDLTNITIPDSVTSIGSYAFYDCLGLTSVVFENPNGWSTDGAALSAEDLSDPATAAKYLSDTYYWDAWTRA